MSANTCNGRMPVNNCMTSNGRMSANRNMNCNADRNVNCNTNCNMNRNANRGENCGENRKCSYSVDEINLPLGMAYVPWQRWGEVYDINKGFMIGTIFPELNMPFMWRGNC